MVKKFIAGTAAGILALSSVAASAAPVAFETADRNATPLADAEAFGRDGMGEIWLVFLFLLIAAGIILLVESQEDDIDDLPESP